MGKGGGGGGGGELISSLFIQNAPAQLRHSCFESRCQPAMKGPSILTLRPHRGRPTTWHRPAGRCIEFTYGTQNQLRSRVRHSFRASCFILQFSGGFEDRSSGFLTLSRPVYDCRMAPLSLSLSISLSLLKPAI